MLFKLKKHFASCIELHPEYENACFLQDVQTEVPSHLLHLKGELEKSRLMVSVQECQAELARENRSVLSMGSERLIKEHRVRATSITPLYTLFLCFEIGNTYVGFFVDVF